MPSDSLPAGSSPKPEPAGIEIAGLGLEFLLRTLKGSLGALSGRLWFACPADRYIQEQLVAQGQLLLLEVFLELISMRLTCDCGSWGAPPDTAISCATLRPNHGV